MVKDTSDTGTNPDARSVSNPEGSETDNPFKDHSNDLFNPTEDPTTYIIPPVPRVQLYKK